MTAEKCAEIIRTNWWYFWSALAQSLATIATLVFTVTLVVSQMRTRYGIHLGRALLNWSNAARFGFLLYATAAALAAIHWTHPCWKWHAVAAALLCIPVLLWHFLDVRRSLSLQGVVDGFVVEAGKQLGAGKAALEPIRRLEEIAHGALSQSDFDVLHAAARGLAKVACAAYGRQAATSNGGHAHLAARESVDNLNMLCFRASSSPKAHSVVLHGVIAGSDVQSLQHFAPDIADMLDLSLRMCQWPTEEATFAAAFKNLKHLLALLSSRDADWPGADEYVERILQRSMALLDDLVRVEAVKPIPGSGYAALSLLRSCVQAAPSGDSRAKAVNSSIKAALEVSGGHGGLRLQRYSGQAVAELLRAVRAAHTVLEDAELAGHLGRVTMDVDDYRPDVHGLLIDLFALLVSTDKHGMSADVLANLNVLCTKTPCNIRQRLAVLVAVAAHAPRIAAARKLGSAIEQTLSSLVRDWHIASRTHTRLGVALHRLAVAYAATIQQDAAAPIGMLAELARRAFDEVNNDGNTKAPEKNAMSYVALSIAGLEEQFLSQFSDSARRDTRTREWLLLRNKYTLIESAGFEERAKIDFPGNTLVMEKYYRGR